MVSPGLKLHCRLAGWAAPLGALRPNAMVSRCIEITGNNRDKWIDGFGNPGIPALPRDLGRHRCNLGKILSKEEFETKQLVIGGDFHVAACQRQGLGKEACAGQ